MALIKANLAEINAISGDMKIEWERVTTEFLGRSYVTNIWGESDSGKTTLSLTAPGPIGYIHNNDKVAFVLESVAAKKEIWKIPFRSGFLGSTDEVQELASAEVVRVIAHIRQSYGWSRSLIVDHESALWDLFQLAELGTLVRADMAKADSRMGQLIYAKINAKWLNMIMDIRENGKINLIFVSKSQNERIKSLGDRGQWVSVETNKIIAKRQKSTFSISDVVLHTWIGEGNKYFVTIDKPWNNGPMRGVTLPCSDPMNPNEPLPLSEIVGLITKTDSTEWE